MKLHKLFYNVTVVGNCSEHDNHKIGKQMQHALIHGLNNLIVLDVECEQVESILPMTEEELEEMEREEGDEHCSI